VRIKSEHCLELLKARFQHLKGHHRVIKSKQDLDVILQVMMCMCILHNLLISHTIPEDWMDNTAEVEDEEAFDYHGEMGSRRDQLLAYLMETC